MLQHTLTNTAKIERSVSRSPRAGTRAEPRNAAAKEQDERLATLQALLANPHFRASERNKRFLTFVVEETIAGRADRIKAFTIAVDVFGRDADFDATVDPIVRIAAGQLRKSLNEYYAGQGRMDDMRISLPLGAYVPSFKKCSRFKQALQRLKFFLTSKEFVATGLAVVTAAAIGYGTVFALSVSDLKAPAGAEHAVVVLDSARSGAADQASGRFAHALTEALWVQMGRHDAIRLIGVRAEEKLDAVVSQARKSFSDSERLYQLLTTVQVENDNVRVYWHLVDADSRETYYSSRVSQEVAVDARNTAADAIAANMAASLFGYDGVLSPYADGAKVLANDLSR